MRIAFIGLGEAAGALISGWGAERSGSITAFDVKSLAAATRTEIDQRAAALGITACDSAEAALAGAVLVFSTVTADQAEQAAVECAAHLAPGTLWCDLNSCSPRAKQAAAQAVTGQGARYLDVAVMAPVRPKRNMVPCLASGPDADGLAETLRALPMQIRVVGEDIGRASSIKLVRSIMVKGLEALTTECALAAVAAGVADEVFPTLRNGHPHIDMPVRASYNFERMAVHGHRRAAEMEACAQMLRDLDIYDGMSLAAAAWQTRVAGAGMPSDEAVSWDEFADHMLHRPPRRAH